MDGYSSLDARLLDCLLEGFQVISFDWRYVYVNEAVARQGRSSKAQLLGKTMMEAYPGIENTEMFSALKRCMEERIPQRLENEFKFENGDFGWFELVFEPVPEGVFILSMDVTEKKRAEKTVFSLQQQLWHSQKMDAIGQFAGAIAHDLNNILSVVQIYSSLILEEIGKSSPISEDVAELRRAGERATSLTRQLLALSRRQVFDFRNIDINQLALGMTPMFRRLLGKPIELEFHPQDDLYPVLADPGQIEHVLLNLIVNARDAMPTGGKLTVETSNVKLNGDYTSSHLGVEPGEYVLLAVSDTGMGMDEATVQRIFEPFFTTKEQGKGTGLGLSTVYGIVKQSGGHIWVYSEPGIGTSVKLYFPKSTAALVEARREEPIVDDYRGTETILLVENDGHVRAAATEILKKYGYKVLEAIDAEDAEAQLESHRGEIDLLLADVVIPKMYGTKLARKLTTAQPGLKVLLMSGFTDEAARSNGVAVQEFEFLQKPLTPETLLGKIRSVLSKSV